MSLSSLPTALLIPPLNLLPFGLAGLLVASRSKARSRRRIGLAIAWLALGGLFVLSMPFASMLLIRSLEAGLERRGLGEYTDTAAAAAGPKAIVILGGDAGHGSLGGIEQGSGIGALTLERMRAGALLQHRTALPVLVSGGELENGSVAIGRQMATSLENEFATPVRWVEAKSDDTWENAQFSAALLRLDGIDKVFVVTHAWHMRRALMAFTHFGIAAVAAPIRLDRAPVLRLDDFLPSSTSLHNSYYALHEWIGIAYYALRQG